MKKHLLLLSICCLSIILNGCTAVKLPAEQLYAIAPGNIAIVKSHPTSKTILVSRTEAAAAYNNDDMRYVKGHYQIASFTENRWVAPPAKQITPLIVKALQQSNHYHGVVTAPFPGVTDLRLQTRLVKLQQVFEKKHSFVSMRLDAQLVNADSGKIIAEKNFNARVPAPENNPYGGVVATNKAMANILKQLVQFCVSH